MKADGPPGASAHGFNENLTLFASGKAALWIDATSGAGPLYDKAQSQVSDKVAFANAPIAVTPNGSHWLWSWAFDIPQKAKQPQAALIAFYSSPEGLFWAKLSAASILAVAPIMVMGWLTQKQLVRSLTFGAVK